MLIINIWEHSLNQAFRDQILQSSGNKSYFRRKLVLLQGRTRWNFFSTKVCPSGLPNFICKKWVTDRKSKRVNTSFTLILNPLRHVRTCQRFNKHSFLLHSCLCVSGGNTTVLPQHPKGAAVTAGSRLPTAWEADLEGSTAAGPSSCPQQWPECAEVPGSWQSSGKGLQQGVCTVQGTRAWRGLHKAAFISPCRATLTCSAPALKELLSHGGQGWGDQHGGNTFDPLVLLFQKNYWCCLACQCNVTIEMSASCKSAFCFPKRKQAGILIREWVSLPLARTDLY